MGTIEKISQEKKKQHFLRIVRDQPQRSDLEVVKVSSFQLGNDHQNRKTGARANHFIEKIKAIIEERLDEENFCIAKLCRAGCISRAQLHRNIKKFTNLTTTAFINGIRLQHARALLVQNNDLNITQVSMAVGYSDARYFSRLFKKTFHQSPRVYRKTSILLTSSTSSPLVIEV